MSTAQPSRRTLKDFGLDVGWLAGRLEQSPTLLDLTDGVPKVERTDHAGA